jgi:hypothetical protein
VEWTSRPPNGRQDAGTTLGQLFFEVVAKKAWKLRATALLEHFGHCTRFFPCAVMDMVTLNFLLHFPQM